MDILALLQPIVDNLSKTTLRQMSQVIIAMLATTRRVMILGHSRWAEGGGRLRSMPTAPDHPAFLHYSYSLGQVFWSFFSQRLLCKEEVYILVGDESMVSKAKKEAKKVKSAAPKRKRGRPKGSKN